MDKCAWYYQDIGSVVALASRPAAPPGARHRQLSHEPLPPRGSTVPVTVPPMPDDATLGGIHRKPSFWFPFCGVTNCAEKPHKKEANSHEFQHCVTGLGERWSRLDHQKPKLSQLFWENHPTDSWIHTLTRTYHNRIGYYYISR